VFFAVNPENPPEHKQPSSNESEFVALIADEFRTCIASLYMAKVTSGLRQVTKKNHVF
jgi:hypothetical protein